ncbi:MAG: thiamine-phosphate kinase [Solirubrobacteraceae bacterium]|nr:thiamine-phosphate kinase [Solirubrobacteraceae bacterium]
MTRGEFELIDAFRARLPLPGWRVEVGSGDDAAVVRAGGSRSVISVDTTVDGTHARLDLGDRIDAAHDFGWRALTTALSDLAACGAPPGEAYVALTLPRTMPDELLLALADGLAEAARTFGIDVVGGDVTSGPVVVASVTVVGWLTEHEAPLTRAGAQPGDLIGLTGPIGAAGAGLALELGRVRETALPAEVGGELRAAYRRPVPQVEAGPALRAAGAHAAIDLSDGLLADAAHVARASALVLDLDPAAVPLARGVAETAAALTGILVPATSGNGASAMLDPAGAASAQLLFAATAGDDYELLVAVPPANRAAAEAAGITTWIGTAREPAPGESPGVTGLPEPPSGAGGHDHRV